MYHGFHKSSTKLLARYFVQVLNLSQPFHRHQLGNLAQGSASHPGSGGHGWKLGGGAAALIAANVASQDTFALALVA